MISFKNICFIISAAVTFYPINCQIPISPGQQQVIDVAGFVVENSPQIVDGVKYIYSLFQLPEVFANSIILNSTSRDFYVHRPDLERELEDSFTSTPDGNYYIVYGHKGVGKTELVPHSAIGRKAHSKEDIVKDLFEKLLIRGELKIGQMVDEMEKVKMEYDIYPTIIFDVELSGTRLKDFGIDAVRALAKALAETCRCVIILSEANAVLEFGKDDREQFFLVGELSEEEAIEFLKVRGCKMSDEELREIFGKIGTRPTILKNLVKKNMASANEYVNYLLNKADQDLAAFPLKTILQALKDPQHAEGVDPKYFNNQIERGVDLPNHKEVGVEMKKSPNPIIFNMKLQKYQLLSPTHKTALRSYGAPIPNPHR